MIKLALFTPPTKKPTISHPMTEQTDPYKDMDARPFCFELRPDFTTDRLKVYGNATILSNGHCTAQVDSIYNKSQNRQVRDPYTEELRDAVREAAAAHFEDEAFCKHLITRTKVYF